jgi:hypothetical protein
MKVDLLSFQHEYVTTIRYSLYVIVYTAHSRRREAINSFVNRVTRSINALDVPAPAMGASDANWATY